MYDTVPYREGSEKSFCATLEAVLGAAGAPADSEQEKRGAGYWGSITDTPLLNLANTQHHNPRQRSHSPHTTIGNNAHRKKGECISA
ncbi:hypothetical protein BDQ17DRAFT_1428465 [Cyathus striatus]|nr:hypothetical protein BDQ17DRAFT_1428465 [Cyathus striatus]